MERIESPQTGDNAIEKEIQAKGLTAPRITPADLAANIASEHYFTAADAFRFGWLTVDVGEAELRERQRSVIDSLACRSYSGACIDIDANVDVPGPLKLLTFCVLVLRNGFTVTGESACASPENFDAEIGRKIARENAVNKVWPLMGYALKQQLHNELASLEPQPMLA
jgi:hypothetical protein